MYFTESGPLAPQGVGVDRAREVSGGGEAGTPRCRVRHAGADQLDNAAAGTRHSLGGRAALSSSLISASSDFNSLTSVRRALTSEAFAMSR